MSPFKKFKFLSIIIPVYNASDFIGVGLSVFSDAALRNIQLIFVNDGSQDNSIEVIHHFIESRGSAGFDFEIIETENKGVSSARNTGLKHATGKFVMFLDADDSLNMRVLEGVLDYLMNNDCNLFVGSYREVEHHSQECEKEINIKEVDFFEFKDLYVKGELLKYISLCSCVYELELIKLSGINFNESISFGEDQLFLIQYMKVVKSFKINLKKPILNYLQHSSSATKSFNYKRFDAIRMLEMIREVGGNIAEVDLNSRINKELVGISTLYYKCNDIVSSLSFFYKKIRPMMKGEVNNKLFGIKDLVFTKTPIFYMFFYKFYLKVFKRK